MRIAAPAVVAGAAAVAAAIVLAVYLYKKANQRIRILDQGAHFYAAKAEQTRRYLSRVYPLAAATFAQMDPLDLASFYNGLDFVYNCCYAYRGALALGGGWDALACCSDVRNHPPYVPQGNFYFWPTYAVSNRHTAYSDGATVDGNEYPLAMWGSQRPDVPWGMRADGGEIGLQKRSGPAPYWITLYSVLRNIYYPYGPVYDRHSRRWTWHDGIDVDNRDNMGIPTAGRAWAFGLAEGEYVEVSHSANDPGMVQSLGFWMNPFYNGGTGMFYRITRSKVAVNKMDAVFKLMSELRDSRPDMRGTRFDGRSGREILLELYGTDDPYTIVWRYCASAEEAWPPLAKTGSGGWAVVPRQWVGIDNKGILAASGLFNPGEFGRPGAPYGPNAVVTFSALADWYAAQYAVPRDRIVVASIDAARRAQNYILDRVGTIVAFDEPIFWAANVLGYESVQLTVSANANGLWSPEVIHTAVPDRAWAVRAKERVYEFLRGDDASAPFDIDKDAPRYTVEAVARWKDMLAAIITQRNPLDLAAARACSELAGISAKTVVYNDKHFSQWGNCSARDTDARCWNTVRNDHGESGPQCATRGQWGTDPGDNAVFPGRTFWGYRVGDKCYPFYENIFCDGGLAADYSMIRIYTGADLGRV